MSDERRCQAAVAKVAAKPPLGRSTHNSAKPVQKGEASAPAIQRSQRIRKRKRAAQKDSRYYLRKCYPFRTWLWSDEAMKSEAWMKRKNRVATCGKATSKTWIARVHHSGKHFLRPAHCHGREHRNCRPNDARARIGRIKAVSLVTFTIHKVSARSRVRDMWWLTFAARVERFFRLWRSRWGWTPQYVRVLEPHKTGWPHAHVVLDLAPWELALEVIDTKHGPVMRHVATGALQRWLSETWRDCGGGWSVRWEVLEKDGAYIAKYLDKVCFLPEDVQALIITNKVKLLASSQGLKVSKPAGLVDRPRAWETCRGSKEKTLTWFERRLVGLGPVSVDVEP